MENIRGTKVYNPINVTVEIPTGELLVIKEEEKDLHFEYEIKNVKEKLFLLRCKIMNKKNELLRKLAHFLNKRSGLDRKFGSNEWY